ncbi:MAG: 4-(cytidine 5'-diphospho)-2-C-methyl-D-erythritol kinase [Ruminococcus sp.]|nr:4-(cytidine 5'-diphospho)-2-C-methyl-D-erythritol kinase [Ruminococcus sp.]
MKIRTAAKINLALDVTGRLPDGYHLIESVFQSVGLYDDITVELTDNSISVSCDVPEMFAQADPIPCDERNIAFKAAKLFFEENDLSCGCSIHIVKGIPSQAGMGGGSTDAAAVLHCLNVLTDSGLTLEELSFMGKKLGADVPFCLAGGTAYVEGIGEKLVKLPDYDKRILVIAKGTQGVSTGEAYARIDALVSPVHPQTGKLVDSLKSAPDTAYMYFGNLFEQAVQLEEVDMLKSAMLNKGALKANMTGSGSAVFGLFDSREAADICALKLRNNGYFAQVCETVSKAYTLI